MNRKKSNNRKLVTFLLTGFIFFANFIVFIDFTIAEENRCCETTSQCEIDNDCDMTIKCGTAHVVILIPLYRTNEEKFLPDIIENNRSATDHEFPESRDLTGSYKLPTMLITPSTYINTPLLN